MTNTKIKKRVAFGSAITLLLIAAAIIISFFFIGGTKAEAQTTVPDISATQNEDGDKYMNIVATNLMYGDYIYIYYAVDLNLDEQMKAENIKMLFWNSPQESYTIDSGTHTHVSHIDGEKNTLGNDITIDGEVGYSDCANFTSHAIAPKETGDTFYARAYLTDAEGNEYYSNVTKYSVLEYVYSRYALKEAGNAVTDSQIKLYSKILEHGANAQKVLGYKTNRLVTSQVSYVSIEGGHITDGFTSGYYLEGDELTLIADMGGDLYFSHWVNSAGETVSTDKMFVIKITEDSDKEVYTAVYGNYNPTAEVLPVKGGANGIVSIVHDDGNVSTVYNLEEIFYKYDLVGTLALMSKHSKTTSNVAKWNEVLATGRWKVASHSATHTWWGTATDNGDGTYTFADNETKMNDEIVNSQAVLREFFPGQKVLAFVYPGFATEKNTYVGAYAPAMGTDKYNKILEFIYSPESRALIAENYVGARYDSILAGNEAYVDNVRDFYYMNGGFISTDDYISGNIKARLDDAANGGFHLLSLHTCADDGEITPEAMDSVGRMLSIYVKEGKIWNAFYEDALLYVKEAQNSTVSISGNESKLTVTLTDTLDDSIYDYALTVRINAPHSWVACKIVQGDSVSYATVKTLNGNRMIDAEIVPDGGDAVITPVALSEIPEEDTASPALPVGPETPDDGETDNGYDSNPNLAIDKLIDFETDPGVSASGNGTVAFGNRDGGKTLKMLDATSSQGHWTVPFGSATGVERFIFTFDINVASASGAFNTTFYFADSPNNPYMLYLNAASGSYSLGDCQSNSGGAGKTNGNLTGTLSYGTWYTVKIDVTVSGDNGFLATWYVMNADGEFVQTGESTNFCNPTKATDATPGTTITYFKASSLTSATVEMYFDNMIMQAGTHAQFNAGKSDVDMFHNFDSAAGVSSAGNVTYTSETPTGGTSNALCATKTISSTYTKSSLKASTAISDAAAVVLEFDLNVASISSGLVLQLALHSDLAKTPYIFAIEGSGSGFKLGDRSKSSGVSTAFFSDTVYSYNTTYHIKLVINIGSTAEDFLATLYVDETEIGTSQNFGKEASTTVTPCTNVDGVTFHWLSSATFKMYFDNLSLKADKTSIEVPEEPESDGFGEKLENGHIVDVNFFPGFVRKTVSFTLDDGLYEYDKKVVDILKPYGFTGTFNINNPQTVTDPTIYDGFEVANHHILHAVAEKDSYAAREKVDSVLPSDADTSKVYLKSQTINGEKVTGLYYVYIGGSWHPMASNETYTKYLEWTDTELEKIFGSGSVVGFAYPHGNQYNDAVIEYLKSIGYLYGRRTGNLKNTTGFALPEDRFTWTYNASHADLLDVMADFDAYEDDGELKMFSFGVHAKDFETNSKWGTLETFALVYGNRPEDFWYATNREIFEYEDAIKALSISEEKIVNDSDIDVYIKIDGVGVVIEANSEYVFN